MNSWLLWSSVRVLVHISFVPSGEKTGSMSVAGEVGDADRLAERELAVLRFVPRQPQVVVRPGSRDRNGRLPAQMM